MAGFHYRMQSILNLKLKMEEQAKMEFSMANMRLHEEEVKLRGLYARQDAYLAEARRLREHQLNLQKLRENETAQKRIQEYIEQQKLAVKAAEKVVEAARIKLQEYRIDRKTHEKLKENAFEEFKQEENRRESKEVDELTSYVYGRRITAADHTQQ